MTEQNPWENHEDRAIYLKKILKKSWDAIFEKIKNSLIKKSQTNILKFLSSVIKLIGEPAFEQVFNVSFTSDASLFEVYTFHNIMTTFRQNNRFYGYFAIFLIYEAISFVFDKIQNYLGLWSYDGIIEDILKGLSEGVNKEKEKLKTQEFNEQSDFFEEATKKIEANEKTNQIKNKDFKETVQKLRKDINEKESSLKNNLKIYQENFN